MRGGCVIKDLGAWIAAIILVALAGQPSMAAERPMTPAELAGAIEARASRSSWAELQAYGDAAGKGRDAESLRRLAHTANVLLSQSEFELAARYNDRMAVSARAQANRRYQLLARINVLRARRTQGDQSVEPELRRLSASSDWFVRAQATAVWARMLMDATRAGDALKVLQEAEARIPAGDPDATAAEAVIWEVMGLGLMDLNDLQGAARAFQRSQVTYVRPGDPRPDFDAVYNLAQVAVQLGDGPLAKRLRAAHHRLSERSRLPNLILWDHNLCAMVAEAFEGPREVLACLESMGPNLAGDDFLDTEFLPARAIAYARLGDVAAARADLARFRAMQASGKFEPSCFYRLDEVAAEILAAESPSRAAFEALRDYERVRRQRTAQTVSGGVRQVSDSLEGQVAAARREVDLEHDAVVAQQWVIGLGVALILGVAGVLLLQLRNARRLRAAQQDAEAASHAKTEFLANMSHEIRTPLNGVVGMADMLLRADLAERERHMAELIRDSGRSLERLLSDVLDLAKIEAGEISVEVAAFHAGDLVRSTAALLALRAEEKGLRFEATVAPAAERWVQGDAARVRQILMNLLSNAVKFTESGGVTLALQATGSGGLRFVVSDTGIGFGPEEKARLFGRFQQADGSITRRFGGTGLGLSISRHLAELMGGELGCESTPGAGSQFWFKARFAAAEAPAEVGGAVEDVAEGRPVRVLVADDHPTNQTVVRMMLESFGVEAVIVDDGAQALELFAAEAFDAVFMDMQMPVMDGLEATRRIRELESLGGRGRTPVIMLSANALPEHQEAGRRAGADSHLAKPVTVDRLLMALSVALSEPEATDAAA